MNDFSTVFSACAPFPGGDIAAAIGGYEYALLIRTDGVSLVRPAEGFSVENLIEARAFKENEELHLVKLNGAWRGRVRTDGAGEETEVFDQCQLLWGECVECGEKASALWEDRGIRLSVPLSVPKGRRVYLSIRSYLAAESFTFSDFRICGIGFAEVKKDAD